jgi:hypothetical protein
LSGTSGPAAIQSRRIRRRGCQTSRGLIICSEQPVIGVNPPQSTLDALVLWPLYRHTFWAMDRRGFAVGRARLAQPAVRPFAPLLTRLCRRNVVPWPLQITPILSLFTLLASPCRITSDRCAGRYRQQGAEVGVSVWTTSLFPDWSLRSLSLIWGRQRRLTSHSQNAIFIESSLST